MFHENLVGNVKAFAGKKQEKEFLDKVIQFSGVMPSSTAEYGGINRDLLVDVTNRINSYIRIQPQKRNLLLTTGTKSELAIAIGEFFIIFSSKPEHYCEDNEFRKGAKLNTLLRRRKRQISH